MIVVILGIFIRPQDFQTVRSLVVSFQVSLCKDTIKAIWNGSDTILFARRQDCISQETPQNHADGEIFKITLICHQSMDLAIILFHPFSALAFTANSKEFN